MFKWIKVLFIISLLFLSACELDEVEQGEEDRARQGDPENPGTGEPDEDNSEPEVPEDPISRIDYENNGPELSSGRITYVGKLSNITDFRGFGQHLYYFPAFDLNSPDDFHRTDDDAAYFNDRFNDFVHHKMLSLNSRTFSPDAGGSPLGVKARGGHADWPMFTLPNGVVGLSGTIYDDATRDNSNNTFNQIKINRSSPTHFCLNIIVDNSNLENIPDVKLVARSDESREDVSLQDHPDFNFDGSTDMYTFRYENMANDGKIKIKMNTSRPDGSNGSPVTGAGVAGVMISDYETCAPSMYSAQR